MLKLKKTLGILLALCFVLSVTTAAVSAHENGPIPGTVPSYHNGPAHKLVHHPGLVNKPMLPHHDGPAHKPVPGPSPRP